MANMFGALNRFISRLDSDPNAPTASQQRHQTPASGNHYGFQILRNLSTSIPLDPWFDFIIGINGHNIENPDPNLFITELKNCAGSTISLGVYGAKGSQIREIYITVPPAHEALGLALQWAPLSSVEDVWHILDVVPNSPADVAGLLPYSDYVIGSPEEVGVPMHGNAAVGALSEQFLDRPLRLYVYNQEYDVTRMVTITPARSWGGEGTLGCEYAYGALHRIPAPLNEPSTGPGETLFTSDDKAGSNAAAPTEGASADFLVPANLQFDNNNTTSPPPAAAGAGGPPPSGGPPAGRAKKARAHHAPAAGLDDYFAEGEQKSRELDNAPTPKATGGLPPPPGKGPPKAASPAPPAADDEKAEEA